MAAMITRSFSPPPGAPSTRRAGLSRGSLVDRASAMPHERNSAEVSARMGEGAGLKPAPGFSIAAWRSGLSRRPHKPEVVGSNPTAAIDPTTEAQRTQRAHETWGSGSNPVHPLRGPRIGLSASVVNESRSHEAAITPGAVAHARRRVLPDAVAVLIRIGWMVVGAAVALAVV